jgi:hypothetical protein
MKISNSLQLTILCCAISFSQISIAAAQGYRDSTNDFALQIPADLAPQQNFSKGTMLSDAWSVNASKNNFQQKSLLEVNLESDEGKDKHGDAYYYHSYLRIGKSSQPTDVTNCEKPTNILSAHGTRIINGHHFYQFNFADAGMSQFTSGTTERHRHNGVCYTIEYVQTGNNNVPDLEKHEGKNKVLAEKMINSFVFLR